jgi:DNA polymerase-3 subunit epsilon
MKYVIVDIETTGGNPTQGGITEIAALLYENGQEVDRFHSLINPERFIPGFITGLTGIDQEMVQDSPTFSEIAEELFDFLKGNVFVAHNVNFDYSFIREAFKKSGFQYDAPKLCTVRLSRKAFPGFHSYSLGRICEQLQIKISNRHRAFGDAEATAILFGLIEKKSPETILSSLKRNSGESFLPPNISKEKFLKIPEGTGIYYFHDKNGKVIYVGKALNIRERFKGHFSGNSKEKLNLKSEIHDISWQLTGSEFLAYLIELLEIKNLWPKYNKALKYKSSNWALYQYEDGAGYIRLQVAKNTRPQQAVYEFDSHSEAWKFLMDKVEEFDLCPKLAGIQKAPNECHDYKINKCRGACCGKESSKVYNKKINQFIDSIESNYKSILIREKGIHPNEHSALYFEKGVFSGYGFFDENMEAQQAEYIIGALQKVKHQPETRYILRSFVTKINPIQIQVF